MAIQDYLKKFLRMFGHALGSSTHERLTGIELRIDEAGAKLNGLAAYNATSGQDISAIRHDLAAQIQDLASSDAALLTASIRLVESSRELHAMYDGQTDLLVRVESLSRALGHELSKLETMLDRGVGVQIESLASSLGRIDHELLGLEAKVDQASDFQQRMLKRVDGVLQNELVHQVCIETSDYDFANPEVGLICYLHAYLPSRRAIDVGANVGDVSRALLKAGYEIYAFEPSPAVYATLVERVGANREFHPFRLAIGSKDGELPLYLATDLSSNNAYGDAMQYSSLAPHSMPDDLPFTGDIQVPVKALSSLHHSGALPPDIALLKIDTEGFDLEVIRGMGENLYPVVAAEFWDAEIPFAQAGQRYTLEGLVAEMKGSGYPWHLVLYRVWGRNQSAYYCGHPRSVPSSWGNVFFFREYDLFTQAQKWCSAVLPQTYFKPVPAASSSANEEQAGVSAIQSD